jgi:hypothetical protein
MKAIPTKPAALILNVGVQFEAQAELRCRSHTGSEQTSPRPHFNSCTDKPLRSKQIDLILHGFEVLTNEGEDLHLHSA